MYNAITILPLSGFLQFSLQVCPPLYFIYYTQAYASLNISIFSASREGLQDAVSDNHDGRAVRHYVDLLESHPRRAAHV